ncbi:hypothetical protein F5Y10DRAFT_260623 [Nemania abortiva]|nr:hypothetical protein F5Y10DRAFT_260623 [Nemania abortiva]
MDKGQFERTSSRLTPAIRANPFLLNDKSKGKEAEANLSVSSTSRMDCNDPMCRATHAGHQPFRHNVSYSKHGSEHSRRAIDPSDASNQPLQAGSFEEPPSNTNFPSNQANDIHRHHSVGFHSDHHIAEHLSSAVGHNAYDLLKGRKKKNTQPISKASIKSGINGSPYPEPFTMPKSVTQMGSFQWTQDAIPPGHPSRSGSRRQRRSPLSKEATNPSEQEHIIASKRTTHDAINTVPGESPLHNEQREVHSDLDLSRHGNVPPRLRLASTPSWLRNPAKGAADAITPLHHVDTKSHDMHEHDHGYLSNIVVHPQDDHDEDYVQSRSGYKTESREERHILSKLPDAPSSVREAPKSAHATPKIQIDPTPPERKQRNAPVPVSKRREIFEFAQDHTPMTSPAKKEAKDTHLHSDARLDHEENSKPEPLQTLRPQGPSKALASTADRSKRGREQSKEKPSVEQSPELEIAKPMPIAPPNHDCAWKDRYLALTAEIRQLKAEISTRVSHRSSGFLTDGYEQHDDDLDLLGVTVNLHFRDRGDVVISTPVTRDTAPSN